VSCVNVFRKTLILAMGTNALPSSRTVALLSPNSITFLSRKESIKGRRAKAEYKSVL
jgi:hypothetical protein